MIFVFSDDAIAELETSILMTAASCDGAGEYSANRYVFMAHLFTRLKFYVFVLFFQLSLWVGYI